MKLTDLNVEFRHAPNAYLAKFAQKVLNVLSGI